MAGEHPPNGLEMSRLASARLVSRIRFAAAGQVGSIELLGRMQMAFEQTSIVVERLFADLASVYLQDGDDWNRGWFTTPGAVAICSLEGRKLAVRGDEERMKAKVKSLSVEGRAKLILQLADLCVRLDREVDVIRVLGE